MITERMQKRFLYQVLVEESMDSEEIDLTRWTWPWREILLTAERPHKYAINERMGLRDALLVVADDNEETAREWRHEIEEIGRAHV